MKRADLIKALDRLKIETGSIVCLGCGYEHNCCTQGCALIRAAVEELSAADVRPVVHGTWEFMETENIWSHAELSHFYIQCSICKSQFFTDTPKLRFAYEYCPCCGADMRET